jgi:hypothetical protein
MTQAVRVKKIRVGDDIMTYCGKCKAERTHIIAAIISDTAPAEVICRTCNSKHRFRRGSEASASGRESRPRASGGAAQTRRRTQSAAEPPPTSGRPYSPAESFKEGEWIEHKLYGVGSVKAVRAGKIDVSFESGVRTLVHVG